MSIFHRDKPAVRERTPAELQDDLKQVVKIINLVESIISDSAPEIFIMPKYQAMKLLLRKLNSIYLEKKEWTI